MQQRQAVPDNPVLYLGVLGLVVALSAWAGWNLGAKRTKTRTARPPSELWLCDGCHSFNVPTRATCYACHRPRAADARTVAPDTVFQLEQRFGRPIDDGSSIVARLWLAAEEPLLDAWLAAHPDLIRRPPTGDADAQLPNSTGDKPGPPGSQGPPVAAG
jgi:hypothetical protein